MKAAELTAISFDAPEARTFTPEQKEYLSGFLEGVVRGQWTPYVGQDASGRLTAVGTEGATNQAAATEEETIHGFALSEVTKQELWKHSENPLDSWDRLVEHAEAERFPSDENNFRFRYFGMFHVAPAQNSFMLRCRIPAGELTAAQMRGLAQLSDDYGNGKAAITTRSNLQIREIAPRNLVNVVTRLQSLGLTSRGSGVDNIRNITASPAAGVDPQELIDTRPFARALHHYILNSRDLYGLPRKFNVAFEGGGAIDTAADTNDIGFMAVTVPHSLTGTSVRTHQPAELAPGIAFRVELAGISGHKQLASDCGILIQPHQAVAVAAAMIRVFAENGDRTDRKKARLKYLIDRWGSDRFVEETQKKLAFDLMRVPRASCASRRPAVKHGHIGAYKQSQKGLNYLGAIVPVGIMSSRQMRRVAEIAEHYGSGSIRLTPWQNFILTDISDAFLATAERALERVGFPTETSHIAGGLVACTGNQGCKYAAADTKSHAVQLADHLRSRIALDHPINIHFTGCPNSCAQHYCGDIGLQGVGVNVNGQTVEGYHIVLGGGMGADAGIGRQVFTGISFDAVPGLIEHILKTFLNLRKTGETFIEFTRRHELKALQELFTP